MSTQAPDSLPVPYASCQVRVSKGQGPALVCGLRGPASISQRQLLSGVGGAHRGSWKVLWAGCDPEALSDNPGKWTLVLKGLL